MIRVRQVKVRVEDQRKEAIKEALCKKLKVSSQRILNYSIVKESIDAREKDSIWYVYELDVTLSEEKEFLKKNHSLDIELSIPQPYQFVVSGKEALNHRPIIVGSGPAGLFAAYFLAKYHYQPIVIERGESVEKRRKIVETFWKNGILNPNSNVQFGEGGAGLFSDGKLNTLVKEEKNRCKEVFNIFVECGAPKEILYQAKPHIGTDLLIKVIQNLRNKIIQMGGTFYYESMLTDIEVESGKIKSIIINEKEKIFCDVLVLAIGHSARETFSMLLERGLQMEAKPFAVGVRVQHLQDTINLSQYGKKYKDLLPNASYKLTYTSSFDRGVYSFCMCPGGYVVNASSRKGYLVINGMSNHARNSANANSAIVVTISKKDFGSQPLDGMNYQEQLEQKAYQLANGKIPLQLWKDFKEDKISNSFGKIKPEMKGEYAFANLRTLFPLEISLSLQEAMLSFAKKIKGFDDDDVLLAGIESRTSSPVRILRNHLFESNILGIYPCGEGAGYAGGITTSCMDGMKVAEQIAARYRQLD